MRNFAGIFQIGNATRVLDVGGSFFNWTLLPERLRPRLSLLNVYKRPPDLPAEIEWIEGSALSLPFGPGDFDVVFSNSVIEHVGDWAAQRQFAAEIQRLRCAFWVQTPNRNFPIEPHFIGIGVQFLPKTLARPYARFATVRGWMRNEDPESIDQMLEDIRLLSLGDLRALFPDAEIGAERLAGLAKSLIAFRRP